MNQNEIIETSASSQLADVNAVAAQNTQAESKEDAIRALQAELNNVKAILKSFETPTPVENQAYLGGQNFAAENVKQIVAQDFRKIDRLVSLGRLNTQQGTNLKYEILQKAFGNSITQTSAQPTQTASTVENAFTEFEKSNPDFFKSDSRKMIKEYLYNVLDTISHDELISIVQLVEAVENAVIQTHEQCKAHKQAAAVSNDEAKKRLASSALSGNSSAGEASKLFTREEIGKMSASDFADNENTIMDQLRKGLIK